DLTDPVHPNFSTPSAPTGGATLTFELTVSDGEQTSEPDVVNITVVNVNNPPTADAGEDQTVQEGSLVVLNGSASFDPDGDSLAFSWVQIAGFSVSLSDSAAVQPFFTAPIVDTAGETLTFELTVSDGMYSVIDTVNVYVETINQAPIANAGPDQTKTEGSPVTLDGTASSDPGRDSLTFTWTQLEGTTVSLSDPNSPTPTITAPPVGPGGDTLVFQLIVNDGLADSEPDDVSITVLNIYDPPACYLAEPSLDRLWPPNHKLVQVGIIGVTDPNNNQVTLTVTGVTQDEPVNGGGDGDSSPDAVVQYGDLADSVLIRAERSGNGNGRVYQVTFVADDGYESCTGTVTITVPHSKKGTAVDDGQTVDSTLP
ncbi:MAG: hypothetical protein IH919_02850, partial [Deltaproteobacteria bacterium]|nr:hypothetical protein [Deltaproteobacteria bacterium]